MQDYSYQNIFDTLNYTKQTTRPYQLSIWPGLSPNTKIQCPDHWLLNDILSTVKNLDTETYQFQSTIGNILREYAPANMSPNEKFKLFDNHIYVIHIGDEKLTAEISRYAAWAIMKEIGKHHDTTFHQEYFMYPNQDLNAIVARVNEISRIAARESVKSTIKSINGILHNLNFQKFQYSKFYALLYTWLFPKEGSSVYSEHIKKGESLADHMNYQLLSLYTNALNNIVKRYDNSKNKTYNNLYTISRNEMLGVRNHFTDLKDLPIKNLSPISVGQIVTDRKKREQTFINKHIHEKVR